MTYLSDINTNSKRRVSFKRRTSSVRVASNTSSSEGFSMLFLTGCSSGIHPLYHSKVKSSLHIGSFIKHKVSCEEAYGASEGCSPSFWGTSYLVSPSGIVYSKIQVSNTPNFAMFEYRTKNVDVVAGSIPDVALTETGNTNRMARNNVTDLTIFIRRDIK